LSHCKNIGEIAATPQVDLIAPLQNTGKKVAILSQKFVVSLHRRKKLLTAPLGMICNGLYTDGL
jgi:hypothetical protein